MSASGDRALPAAVAVALGAATSWAATAAGTPNSELARCAAITTSDARLACYDALAGRKADAGAASTATVPAAAPAATMTAPATAPTAPGAASADPLADPRNFGLSSAQLHSAPPGPQSIEAHVNDVLVDSLRRNFVLLDNGQTWASIDGELNLNKGEAVTIGRGALGSYVLKSAKSKLIYHVRRVS
jgi:hypothetical protein